MFHVVTLHRSVSSMLCCVMCIHVLQAAGDAFQEGCTVLLNKCLQFGLEPNFSKGKTEALVSLRGPGATKARRKWFTDQNGKLPLPSCLLPQCCINMVARYKHLGGIVDAKAKPTAEIKARVGQMRQAFRKYRKSLFVVPAIAQTKRAQLLRPFVLSILEYNLGTLVGLREGDHQYIATALLSIYKQIMKGQMTDDHKIAWPRLCYALQLPTPTAIVAMAQLRYFSQIYRHGDGALWALISTQGQWLSGCQDAFRWLYCHVENTTSLPDPLVSWEPWAELISQRPKRFAGLIQRAWKHEVIQQYNQLVVQEGYAGFAMALELGNYEFPDEIYLNEDSVASNPSSATHACIKCQRVFCSRTAWASHAFKRHQRINSARRFAAGTYCLSCGTEYWEYKRLMHHLRYSSRCRRNLAMAQLDVELAPGLGSKEQRRQPEELLKPWTTTPTVGLPVHDYWAGVSVKWDEELLNQLFTSLPLSEDQINLPIDTLIDQLRTMLLDTVAEYCVVNETLQCWRESMMDVAQESNRDRAGFIRAFFVVLGQVNLHTWLLPQQKTMKDLHTKDWKALFDGPLALRNGWPRECPSTPWYKTMFVIHFFSGRRRCNDLQSYLEKLPCPAGIHLCILSADIIFGEGADMARKEVQQQWLAWMALGYVLAFFAGPPCETYSIARSHNIPGVRIRPVRSNRYPWGYGSLSLREAAQVLIGNLLILFTLQAAAVQAAVGNYACIEHPAEPNGPHQQDAVSVWKLSLMHQLYRHPSVQRCTVLQGRFGAPSPKPTCLLFVGPSSPAVDAMSRPLAPQGSASVWKRTAKHSRPRSSRSTLVDCARHSLLPWLTGLRSAIRSRRLQRRNPPWRPCSMSRRFTSSSMCRQSSWGRISTPLPEQFRPF